MSEMTTTTRCNWCGEALLFHTARRTNWHGFLCRMMRWPRTFERTPIAIRKASAHGIRTVDSNGSLDVAGRSATATCRCGANFTFEGLGSLKQAWDAINGHVDAQGPGKMEPVCGIEEMR